MIPVSYKVSVQGKVVEQNGHAVHISPNELMTEDIAEIESLDDLIQGIHGRWGKNCDIELLVWRADYNV